MSERNRRSDGKRSALPHPAGKAGGSRPASGSRGPVVRRDGRRRRGPVWTVAKVTVPALVQATTTTRIIPGDTAALWRWSAAIAVGGRYAAVFTGLRRYWAFKVSRLVEATLRHQLFAHLQRLHFAFHDRVQTGDLMSRANTDLQQIQFFVVMIPLTISNFVTVVRRHGDPRVDRSVARAARARVAAARELPGQAVQHPPAPRGDGHPARVGRAGLGGRGDGQRRAGRQGLRLPNRCRPLGSTRGRRRVRRVDRGHAGAGPLPAGARPAAQHRV